MVITSASWRQEPGSKRWETFYQRLQPLVMKHLKHYTRDFVEHDREYLKKYNPESFILAMRDTGTNIRSLDAKDWKEQDPAYREGSRMWLLRYNTRFLHCYQGLHGNLVIAEVDKATAYDLTIDFG